LTESEAAAPVDTGDSGGDEATETKFPKIQIAAEDAAIVHYSPKAHEALDPSKRDF